MCKANPGQLYIKQNPRKTVIMIANKVNKLYINIKIIKVIIMINGNVETIIIHGDRQKFLFTKTFFIYGYFLKHSGTVL